MTNRPQVGSVSGAVELEIHDENDPIKGADLIVGHDYHARVFVRRVKAGSVYIGKELQITVYSGESIIQFTSPRQQTLVVVESQEEGEEVFAQFDFRITKRGSGVLILGIDVFLGYKLLTRIITPKKVASE
jgi:hypothetical protein